LDDVVRIEPEIHEKMSGSKVQFNDVLLNITGASIGRCCVVDINEEMNVNQHVCIIRPNDKIKSDYLNLVLQSSIGQIQIKLGTTGGDREGLNFEAIKDFIIILPDVSTQLEILEKIDISLYESRNLESNCLTQITKLKDYRQSLISEAVTGKIDVREWKLAN
jgi:type I restriction enzyme S subunit